MTDRHDTRADDRAEFRSFPPSADPKPPAFTGWVVFALLAAPVACVFIGLAAVALSTH